LKYRILTILIGINVLFSSYIVPSYDYSNIKDRGWEKIFGPAFIQEDEYWILKQLDTLSIEEKIAQLCFVRSSSYRNDKEEAKLSKLIKKYGIGGITFFKGTSSEMKELVVKYQKESKIPMLFSIDGEWGASMRLTDMPVYPWMMTMGAVQDDRLIYKASAQMAEEFKRIGIHMNLAPDVDVNNNPLNPIINARSFGEDPMNVAKKGTAYMKGHQDNRIMAVAKHFPGHGDTDMDSHLTLPTIPYGRKRLDSIEFIPFEYIINQGISSMMVAHLDIPKLTKKEKLPSSVSKRVVDSLLIQELGFTGLIMTDGLAMRGVQDYFQDGRLELEALKAGNDVLLLPQNVQAVIDTVKMAIETGEYSIDQLNKSVLKVLLMKTYISIDHQPEKDFKDIDRRKAADFKEKIMQQAFTIIKNDSAILPFRELDKQDFVLVTSGDEKDRHIFRAGMDFYQNTPAKNLNKTSVKEILRWLKKNKDKHIIFSVHKSDASPWKSYKLSAKEKELIAKLKEFNNAHFVLFANPYAIYDVNFDGFKSVSLAYQNNYEALFNAPKLLFGALPAKGKLPVGLKHFPVNTGFTTKSLNVLEKVSPFYFGLNDSSFHKVDSIIRNAIASEATPGCQLLVAKDGKIFFEKNYGHFTYKDGRKVDNASIYDIASITKIAATLPNVMHLYEENRLSLKTPLRKLSSKWAKTNKSDLVLKEILTHQARLRPWIPFYTHTLDDKSKKRKASIYQSKKSSSYSVPVAQGIYMKRNYQDSIKNWIAESDLLEDKKYRYSDLGYYIIQDILKSKYKINLYSSYAQKMYASIGADRLGFLPKRKFGKTRIVPSEKDDYYRNQTLVGDVHDMGAAMMGGIAGHAGMFSNAEDLAKMMAVYLNDGNYGGKQYFKKETVDKFTDCVYCDSGNRRGIGFDKPIPEEGPGGPASELVSKKSFGHTGFTGTIAWADPENDMIFVFLSNRTYPTMKNTKLVRMDVRTKLQTEFYKLFNQQ
jgi:beta-glucosidase-like glycosyl hydrolase/CubicO group peptidase (beta-lactamase class C family)